MRYRTQVRRLLLMVGASLSILIFGYSHTLLADSAEQLTEDPNDLRWDFAEAFKFDWNSVTVSIKAANSALDSGLGAEVPVRTISVSASVDFSPAKTEGLVIIDVDRPQVYKVIGGEGRTVEWQSTQSDTVRCYQDFGWHWDNEGHAGTNTPKPFSVEVQLIGDSTQRTPSSISHLEGYMYAIYAQHIIKVDVPFDPNSGWLDVEAAPNLTVLVDPLTPPPPPPVELVSTLPNVPPGFWMGDPRIVPNRPKASLGSYVYGTWVKSKTGQRVLGLRDPRYPSSSYAYGDYAILRTELYDSRRNTIGMCDDQHIIGTAFFGQYGASCSGRRLQSREDAFDTIRHIIIVRPKEVKIPFVLTDICLPK